MVSRLLGIASWRVGLAGVALWQEQQLAGIFNLMPE